LEAVFVVAGASFGNVPFSALVRVGASACESSDWASDSVITCRTGGKSTGATLAVNSRVSQYCAHSSGGMIYLSSNCLEYVVRDRPHEPSPFYPPGGGHYE
jgi:hypothetical protein